MTDKIYTVHATSIDGVHIDRWIDVEYDGQRVYTVDLGTTFTPMTDLAKVLGEHRWDLSAYTYCCKGWRHVGMKCIIGEVTWMARRSCGHETSDGNSDDPSYAYCVYPWGHAGSHNYEM